MIPIYKQKKEVGCPRKQMPEEAKNAMQESANAGFLDGLMPDLAALVEAGRITVDFAKLIGTVLVGSPEESNAAIAEIGAMFESMYTGIEYALENSGLLIDDYVTGIIKMAESKGWDYAVGYLLGNGTQAFIAFYVSYLAAMKAARALSKADGDNSPHPD